ncbi:replication initiator protein [Dipodfec virus UOA04_Rod_524]|nr:replication initiator protein [Dipodfec virus UOA04_Rod_524]
MCLNPRIIVNPTYIKNCNNYPLVHLNKRDFVYTHRFPYEFDFKQFSYRSNGVTIDNIDKYYAYNVSGETINVFMTVPCNKCVECVQSKQSQIVRRCYLEDAASKHRTLFLTLTYDDYYLPHQGVSVDDVQKFFKRLRRNLVRDYDYKEPLRYCLFSEYGKLHGRPHYHALLFNFDTSIFPKFLDFVSFVEKSWNKGFIYVKHLTDAKGIAYCTKYIMKSKFTPYGQSPNFWLASRCGGGLGSPVLKNKDFCIAALSDPEFKVTVKVCGQVKTFHLPRYIYNKLLPNHASFYPQRIVHAVKELAYKLILLHSFEHIEAYDEYTFKHDYLFPPHLMTKYSLVFPQYMQTYSYEFDDPEYKVIKDSIDVPALSQQIDELICVLDAFELDIQQVLNAQRERELHMLPYVEHCLNYINNLPSPDDRAIVLFDECIKVECRSKDYQ